MHDIAEPDQDDTRARKEHDSRLLCEIFDYLGIKCQPSNDFKFVTRAGAKTADNIRPIIVGFHESQKRDRLLANAHKLRNNRDMKSVRILPDLTRKQRESDEKVNKEAERLNAELEQSGDYTHHWRVVGQRGARSLAKSTGVRQQRQTGQKRGPPESTGSTPPARRMALNH